MIEAPLDLVQEMADLRLPPRADHRLQELMDHNTNGSLSPEGRAELETLVEMSEKISLVRARAMHLLGRKPT